MIIDEIKEKKELILNTRTKHHIYINGQLFEIWASGRPPAYSYHISNSNFHIYLTKLENRVDRKLLFHIGQEKLWNEGYNKAYQEVKEFLSSLGVTIQNISPVRIDLCCHSDNFSLSHQHIKRHLVSKCKKFHYYCDKQSSNDIQSLYLGKSSPILLRIYNKTEEVQSTGKLWFFDLWKQLGFNLNNDIYNIEYQVRTKALKEFGIKDLEDLFSKLKELWNYLTTKWASFRVLNKADKNHLDRAPLTKRWLNIVNAFEGFTTDSLTRERKKESDINSLKKMIFGFTTSLMALVNDYPEWFNDLPNKKEMLIQLLPLLDDYEEATGKDFKEIVMRKMELLNKNKKVVC